MVENKWQRIQDQIISTHVWDNEGLCVLALNSINQYRGGRCW